MITEEVYFWSIQWAGTWMITRTRVSEKKIRLEHPEAVCIEGSKQLILTPETPKERVQATSRAHQASPDIRYRVYGACFGPVADIRGLPLPGAKSIDNAGHNQKVRYKLILNGETQT